MASCQSRERHRLLLAEEVGHLAGVLGLGLVVSGLDTIDADADQGLEKVCHALSGLGRALEVGSRLDRLRSDLALCRISSVSSFSTRRRKRFLTYLANGGSRWLVLLQETKLEGGVCGTKVGLQSQKDDGDLGSEHIGFVVPLSPGGQYLL